MSLRLTECELSGHGAGEGQAEELSAGDVPPREERVVLGHRDRETLRVDSESGVTAAAVQNTAETDNTLTVLKRVTRSSGY